MHRAANEEHRPKYKYRLETRSETFFYGHIAAITDRLFTYPYTKHSREPHAYNIVSVCVCARGYLDSTNMALRIADGACDNFIMVCVCLVNNVDILY